MADDANAHVGENSPEYIAYRLMLDVQNIEKKQWNRKDLLDLYAECINAIRNPSARLGEKKPIGF